MIYSNLPVIWWARRATRAACTHWLHEALLRLMLIRRIRRGSDRRQGTLLSQPREGRVFHLHGRIGLMVVAFSDPLGALFLESLAAVSRTQTRQGSRQFRMVFLIPVMTSAILSTS
ncbi:hypothetical protein BDW62DRAFT_128463 [Aspergillus aurantiobrunneus]